MKILTKLIVSSALSAGLIVSLLVSSAVLIRQTEKSVETSQEKANQATQKTLALQLALEQQTSSLKDFLLSGRDAVNLAKYKQASSNFQTCLEELEYLTPQATELAFVRQRHQFLANLAADIRNGTNSTQAQTQQDVKAINSFGKDIALYLELLVNNARQQSEQTQRSADQFKQTAQIVTYSVAGIILVVLGMQFLVILLPVTRSIQQLQLGAAKIGSGDLDYRLDIRTGDEIEQLSHEFNSMSKKLAEFYRCLERKVRDRTNELNQANQSLQNEVAERKRAEAELQQALHDLKQAQTQVIQTEKMSSLGQLVAGVAHEINNPVNFIYGNLIHVQDYTENLLNLVQLYQEYHPNSASEIQAKQEEIELDFLQEDLPKLLNSMKIGSDRIRQIVLSLRNFSRMDEAEFKAVNIHEGIDSTLLILQHRLKAKSDRPAIEVIHNYGNLPLVECYPGQLNQVFMNILANAIDALEEVNAKRTYQEIKENLSSITIRTSLLDSQWVQIAIADNGIGIPEAIHLRIFEPFFTTKPVGKGTGMGMSISYQIVTEQHGGKLECSSVSGKGTEFIIKIPIRQQVRKAVA